MAVVDVARRVEVAAWLAARGLPQVGTGSHYVKSFRPEGEVPARLRPLLRGETLRLCLKPRGDGTLVQGVGSGMPSRAT